MQVKRTYVPYARVHVCSCLEGTLASCVRELDRVLTTRRTHHEAAEAWPRLPVRTCLTEARDEHYAVRTWPSSITSVLCC
jgi:hypothetical protein